MRILLIAPDFYDYHEKIIQEMRQQGNQVTFFAERPVRLLYSLAKRIGGKFAQSAFDIYLRKIVAAVVDKEFDRVVLVRGEIVQPWFVRELRRLFSTARFVMYQWDSLLVVNYRHLLPFFDSVVTFDPADAEELSIEYMPLFYTPLYSAVSAIAVTADLSFVGSYHKSRYEMLCSVSEFCRSNEIVLNSYLYISPFDYLKLLLTGESVPRYKHVRFRKLSGKMIAERYGCAAGVLDIENEKQKGLTIRTFEALATGRFLVTTNSWAKKLLPDLSERILLLDRANISIPARELRTQVSPSEAMQKYSLRSWVERLLAL